MRTYPVQRFLAGLKSVLPYGLFARALLILVVPMVLVQLVSAYIFFERHWDNVTRTLSSSLAGEIAWVVLAWPESGEHERAVLAQTAQRVMGIRVSGLPGRALAKDSARDDYPHLVSKLSARIPYPFTVQRVRDDEIVRISVALPGETLRFECTVKRLESVTTTIFIIWMVGSALVLLIVAIVFLRNQMRPVARLAEAAERFGRGLDFPEFRPSGAREIRQAARAFITMRERIRRLVDARMAMLSGISHDLRTPVTRMKLQLALLKDPEAEKNLSRDLTEMERMIREYLDFAKGIAGEDEIKCALSKLVEDVLTLYAASGHIIPFTVEQEAIVTVRPFALRRVLTNIIDNALRYGARCSVRMVTTPSKAELWIDDEGPGIPPAAREEAFRPFTRLEPSRNRETGGVGLGLTIARDIVLSHGGELELSDIPNQAHGLRVILRLPV